MAKVCQFALRDVHQLSLLLSGNVFALEPKMMVEEEGASSGAQMTGAAVGVVAVVIAAIVLSRLGAVQANIYMETIIPP